MMRTIGALFQKDVKDTLINMNVMIMVALPVLFGALYANIFGGLAQDMPTNFVLNIVTAMTLALIPTSFLATIVAEEKEKHTLRALMLSGVTAGAFIASKVLLTLIIILAVSAVNAFIAGGTDILPLYLALVAAGSLGLLLIGASIGLMCKDQMSTGVLSTPVAMVLLIPTMLGDLNPVLGKIAYVTPIEWMLRFLSAAQGGTALPTGDLVTGILVLALWTLLPALLFGYVYKKQRVD